MHNARQRTFTLLVDERVAGRRQQLQVLAQVAEVRPRGAEVEETPACRWQLFHDQYRNPTTISGTARGVTPTCICRSVHGQGTGR